MKTFFVPGTSVGQFVDRVQQEIQVQGFQDIASVHWDGRSLVVRFSWMGTSTLTYRTKEQPTGFSAELVGQRMSAFHAPFKAGFEERFDRVLANVGARTGQPALSKNSSAV
ncbi:MAG: hypothetical protein K8R59_15040 [Thermoanaerobaculales bacterium]|nr:hypothetical protein [Thermoanaerobaculales bacterium]